MRSWLACVFTGVLLVACGHAQTTGSAANCWRTPVGYASATHPVNIDGSLGVMRNTAARHGGSYDSRFNNEVNAPSDFKHVSPPVKLAYRNAESAPAEATSCEPAPAPPPTEAAPPAEPAPASPPAESESLPPCPQ